MSMTYIVGNPGSGKTYFAVNYLYKIFIAPKKSNDKNQNSYILAYTNINEFDFKKSDKIKPLNFDLFYDSLIELYNLYITQTSDKDLIKKAKELKLFKVLFVIDECHSNIFSKPKDKVIIWWLTYHRHLYQDLFFITQNLSLVGSEYKKIAEFFYKAVDGSKRMFFKKFRYVLFNSPTMYNKRDIVPGGGVSLKFDDEVFSLYHSGNVTKHKSYLKFYFLIVLFIFILILFLYSKFKSSFMSDESQNFENNQTLQTFQTYKQSFNYSDRSKINQDENLTFISYEVTCYLEKCYLKGFKEPFIKTGFLYAISKTPPIFYREIFKEKSKNLSYYFLAYDKSFFFLENLKKLNFKESNYEKTDIIGANLSSPFGGRN